MKSINRFFNILELIFWRFRINWFKTIYFNLRSLPFFTAIKLPVYIYSHTQFATLTGRVELTGEIKRGMVHIGKRTDRGQGVTIIRNMGVIRLGQGVMIFQGCDLLIGSQALLEIEDKVRIRENTLIYVSKYVHIGERTGIAFQSTISEDDYHFVMNTETGEIQNTQSQIFIGKNNWIGSRTVIKKGTITPNNIIVASSNSVLGKDYRSSIPEYSVIGGIPAKLLRTNCRRVYNHNSHLKLVEHFKSCDTPYIFDVENGDLENFCL